MICGTGAGRSLGAVATAGAARDVAGGTADDVVVVMVGDISLAAQAASSNVAAMPAKGRALNLAMCPPRIGKSLLRPGSRCPVEGPWVLWWAATAPPVANKLGLAIS